MATEYDVYTHPELNPLIKFKVSRAITKVGKLCMKLCAPDPTAKVPELCFAHCAKSYIEAVDVVLETLQEVTRSDK